MTEKQYDKNDPYLKTCGENYTLKFGNHKINACPFCGNQPWTGGIHTIIATDWVIECRNCNISFVYSKIRIGGKLFRSKKHLVEYWNRTIIVYKDEKCLLKKPGGATG